MQCRHMPDSIPRSLRRPRNRNALFGNDMNRQLIPISVTIVVVVCHFAGADEVESPTKETRAIPAPVALSARAVKSESKTERTIEIELNIGTEYEIYSERSHEYLLPLKTELLDAQMQPINSTIQYPNPKIVGFDKALGGDYYVYHGKSQLTATCANNAQPAYVRVFYHGYSTRGY